MTSETESLTRRMPDDTEKCRERELPPARVGHVLGLGRSASLDRDRLGGFGEFLGLFHDNVEDAFIEMSLDGPILRRERQRH
jgi:hypothetical protein